MPDTQRETEHTPIPFSHKRNVGSSYKTEPRGGTSGTELIGIVFDETPTGKANAEFIVRACNSHDALLKEINQTISDMQGIVNMSTEPRAVELIAHQVVERLGAILLKARGESNG